MNFTYEVKKSLNTLVIFRDGNEIRSIEIRFKIQQIIISEPSLTVFVLTDPSGGEKVRGNLLCIDVVTGKINWSKSTDKSRSVCNVFTRIKLNWQDRQLTVWDWDGYRYVFDSISGEKINSHFFK